MIVIACAAAYGAAFSSITIGKCMASSHDSPIAAAPFAYRPEIDGLRALAVFMVVFFHAAPDIAPGGFIGVDVFFVLSGYLISGIIWRSLQAQRFSLAGFYLHRCRRILPALFGMMLGSWFIGWFVLMPGEFANLGKEILAGTLFGENMLLVGESGYFDTQSFRKPMLHLWSLGVEEQFYLLWPLLLMFMARIRKPASIILYPLLAVSFAFCLYFYRVNPVAAFYILPTRFWELLCGAALVYLEMRRGSLHRHRALADAKVALGLLLLIGFGFFFRKDALLYGWWALIPCLSGVLFLSAGNGSWLNRALFSSRPAVFLGRISYPLYLWHWPLLAFAYILQDGTPALSLRAGAVFLAVLLAWLTYCLIEKPCQRYFVLPQRAKALAVLSVVGLIIFSAMGYATFKKPGFFLSHVPWAAHFILADNVDPESAQRTLDPNWWGNHNQSNDATCVASTWLGHHTPDYCRLTSPHPTTAILGDSHANHLVPGLALLQNSSLSSLIQISFGGCIGFEGARISQRIQTPATIRDCYQGNQYFFEQIRRDPNIHTVIISTLQRSAVDFDDARTDTVRLEAMPDSHYDTTSGKMQLMLQALSRTIESFEKAGKQVVYVIDVPNLGFDPVTCLSVRSVTLNQRTLRSPCAIPRERVAEQQAEPRAMAAKLMALHPNLRIFDPAPALCDAHYCYGILHHKMLYRDSNHLSVDGSALIAKSLQTTLENKKRAP